MTAAATALALALVLAPPPRRAIAPVAEAASFRRVSLVVFAVPCAVLFVVAVPTVVIVAAAIAAITVVMRRRRGAGRRRRGAEAVELQDALEVLVSELRVGAHQVTALTVAAGEVDGAVADALRRVAARARLGSDAAVGLRTVAAASAVPAHWERMAVCWQLAQAHGLAIGSVLHTVQRDIVERERFSARVHAGMAGARTTAAVLAGLPLLGAGLGQLIGADPVRFLLSGGAGGVLLVAGVTLTCAGLLWSDRITDVAMT